LGRRFCGFIAGNQRDQMMLTDVQAVIAALFPFVVIMIAVSSAILLAAVTIGFFLYIFIEGR
jgi:hypothetical protein